MVVVGSSPCWFCLVAGGSQLAGRNMRWQVDVQVVHKDAAEAGLEDVFGRELV
jgi:hypothetical protein